MHKTTFDVPVDTYRRMHVLASLYGMSVSAFVRASVENAVAAHTANDPTVARALELSDQIEPVAA